MSRGGIQTVEITQLFQSLLSQPDVTVYNDGTNIIAKDKENEIIAEGTFNTDDSTVIQAALDELSSGGICLVKAGTYIISAALTIPASVILTGAGIQTVLKCKNDTQINVVEMPNANAGIRNLKIDGNKANNTGAGS